MNDDNSVVGRESEAVSEKYASCVELSQALENNIRDCQRRCRWCSNYPRGMSSVGIRSLHVLNDFQVR